MGRLHLGVHHANTSWDSARRRLAQNANRLAFIARVNSKLYYSPLLLCINCQWRRFALSSTVNKISVRKSRFLVVVITRMVFLSAFGSVKGLTIIFFRALLHLFKEVSGLRWFFRSSGYFVKPTPGNGSNKAPQKRQKHFQQIIDIKSFLAEPQ